MNRILGMKINKIWWMASVLRLSCPCPNVRPFLYGRGQAGFQGAFVLSSNSQTQGVAVGQNWPGLSARNNNQSLFIPKILLLDWIDLGFQPDLQKNGKGISPYTRPILKYSCDKIVPGIPVVLKGQIISTQRQRLGIANTYTPQR